MPAPTTELLQFPYSHYNEKVRWALDWKGIRHRRTNLLPGPHARRIQKLAPETTVPVLRFDGEVVQGSARILEEIERRHPEPALHPVDPALRARALEIQRHFDDEVGPLVRQALFSTLMDEGGYVCRMFGEGHTLPVRVLYRSMFPIAKRKIAKAYHFDDPSAIEAAFDGVRAGLDFVAKQAGPEGHLVGDRFSIADLGAAALLSPCCNPPDCAMTRPEPLPESVKAWLAGWADHPGTAWVLRTYRDHRPASAAV
jgi:glutathione S-transferase